MLGPISPKYRCCEVFWTGTDDAPVSHSEKVLTKNTSGPVFFGSSVAQSGPFAEVNNINAGELFSNENSFAAKQIGQTKKVEGLDQRPFEKMEAAGIEPVTRKL